MWGVSSQVPTRDGHRQGCLSVGPAVKRHLGG